MLQIEQLQTIIKKQQEEEERERKEKLKEIDEKTTLIQEKVSKLHEEKHGHVAFLKQLLNEDQKRKQIEKEQAALAIEHAKQVQLQQQTTENKSSDNSTLASAPAPVTPSNTTGTGNQPLSPGYVCSWKFLFYFRRESNSFSQVPQDEGEAVNSVMKPTRKS